MGASWHGEKAQNLGTFRGNDGDIWPPSYSTAGGWSANRQGFLLMN